MTDIIIIGNGFDLAHDMRTNICDFIAWYFTKLKSSPAKPPNDVLFSGGLDSYNEKTFLNIGPEQTEVKFLHPFIKRLVCGHNHITWEGVEREYFSFLLKCKNLPEAQRLNKSFEMLRGQFIEYINEIESKVWRERNDCVITHFNNIIEGYKERPWERENQMIWLNFNYTNYAGYYHGIITDEAKTQKFVSKLINIHGAASTPDSVVFGYGDESDPMYPDLENQNQNEFLKYFKSFMYLTGSKYSELIKSIAGKQYNIHIMGHSCGLSDRVLLKELLFSPRCKEIIIYYHRFANDPAKNDYTEKVMNISRVFPIDGKSEMRGKIRPLPDCKPLSW